MTEPRIPASWEEANTVIMFKKGNRKDIKNDMYTNLLAIKHLQTVHKITTTRLEKKLGANQPREQAGFIGSKYSTKYYTHAINQLKENCGEYNIPLCIAFEDYEKAFDSVQTQAILTSLQKQRIFVYT